METPTEAPKSDLVEFKNKIAESLRSAGVSKFVAAFLDEKRGMLIVMKNDGLAPHEELGLSELIKKIVEQNVMGHSKAL